MSLEEVLGKIQSHDLNMKKKETNMEHIQDPSMYFPKSSGKTGAGVAFFSGFSANTSSSSSGAHNMNHRVADDYLAMFSSFMASYENFIGGKIHDPDVTEEDFRQIDPLDLEEMNIQWNMAMLVRQAKDFLKKTGRKYIGSNSRCMGFDKTKVRCYNCQEYGYFAKECVKPKVEFDSQKKANNFQNNRNQSHGSSGSGNSNHASASSALVAQNEENYDWGIHLEDLVESTDDDSSSDGESLPSADEERDQVDNVESDIASGVSEDDIVITQNSSDGADSENIPIAKVFMTDMSDPSKRVTGIGFIPPPFNANYMVEPEIIHEEEIDPKTVLKVNPVTGEDMIYDSDSEDEVFDDKKVEGIPKEVQLDEPKNQGKLKSYPSQKQVVTILKRQNREKPTSNVVKNMPCQSFAKSSGFKKHDKRISKPVVFQKKFEIPHVGIPKESQPEVKLSRPQRRRRNRKLKKFLEIPKSDNHNSNNVFPINHTMSSLRRSSCGSYVPKVDDNVDCEFLEGKPRRTINNTWYVDSGCSRHMTGNIRLLEDVISIDGGYVAFARNKVRYITGQGTLKNKKFKFEKVNYVEQLKHNLLSVSQVCDKNFSFHFNDSECYILKPGFVIPDEMILMKAPGRNDTYVLDMSVATTMDSIPTCLLSNASESDSILWHRKLAHISYRKMNYVVKNDLVFGVPKMKFSVPDDCIPCKKGNNTRSLINLNDFSRFSWVKFLASKAKTIELVQFLILGLENLFKQKFRRIRSDNGSAFKNSKMGLFCLQKGIHHEFRAPYVPQQNGIAERKNRTLVEMARTMLADSKLRVTFWAEAVNTACHVLNRVLTVKRHNKTCYELLNNRKPNLEYLLPFGNPCTLLKVRDVLTKFSAKAIEGIFLGYVANSTTKRVYNKETCQVEEWFHIDCSNRSLPQMAIGPDWAFDYANLFKSFHLPSDISPEEAAVLYDSCQDAQNSGFLPTAVPQSSVPSTSAPDPNAAS
ncbi:hypothetical protein L1987_71003 [Smallanthus sonchifolius]|uniref:Uncharacterized protein n=1 Tax=Smallanthus sonchifolius TaxID=185202 RepID=A0ACB9AR59_9ASTR|nr:hypothetical protein L1987_71003 [Smallanthus sonchifolius]